MNDLNDELNDLYDLSDLSDFNLHLRLPLPPTNRYFLAPNRASSTRCLRARVSFTELVKGVAEYCVVWSNACCAQYGERR